MRDSTFSQNRAAVSGSDDTNIARCILNTTEIFDAPLLSEAERCVLARRFHLQHKSGTLRGKRNTNIAQRG